MTSKVKIKVGNVEIKFKGSEEYMKEELPQLIELLFSLTPKHIEKADNSKELPADTSQHNSSNQKLQMTTNTIASKLSVKSGNELVIASCAHLTFVQGKDTFSRSDILNEMKQASNYYKANIRKNLSNILKTLINQNKILEIESDTYALSAPNKEQLETVLNAS